jgi:hypothetical protein
LKFRPIDKADKAMLLALPKLLGRMVTRQHWRTRMIEWMRRQGRSRLRSMVAMRLRDYTWRT